MKKKKRVWSHFEDKSGKKHSIAGIDGYSFGDRLLEGVMFIISITKDGELKAKVQDSDKDYFSDLNEERWLASAVSHAEENDIFYKVNQKGSSVLNSGDLVLKDINGKLSSDNGKPEREPIMIGKTINGKDLMAEINKNIKKKENKK